jgi:hypothetical protein
MLQHQSAHNTAESIGEGRWEFAAWNRECPVWKGAIGYCIMDIRRP